MESKIKRILSDHQDRRHVMSLMYVYFYTITVSMYCVYLNEQKIRAIKARNHVTYLPNINFELVDKCLSEN